MLKIEYSELGRQKLKIKKKMSERSQFYRKILTFTKFIFITGLFFMAVFHWPGSEIPYEIPKVHFFYYWVKVLVVSGIVLASLLLKRKDVDTKLVVLVLVFAGIALITSVVGVDVEKSLVGNYYRADGLITLFHLLGLFFFVVLFWEKSWRIPVALSVTLGGFTVSILTVIDGIRYYIFENISVSGWGGALGSVFGQPNFLGGYLAVTLPFEIYLYSELEGKRSRSFLIVTLAIQHLAILLTRSWGSVMMVILCWVGYLFLEKKVKLKWLVISVAFGIGIIFSGYYYQERSEILVAEGRERIFRKVFLGFLDRPLSGYGWANVDYAFDSHDWPVHFVDDVYVDKAHSMLLETLVTSGLVGLVSYTSIIIYVLFIFFRKYRKSEGKPDNWTKTLLLVFMLYFVHSQTNIISISEEIFFWLVLGVVTSKD